MSSLRPTLAGLACLLTTLILAAPALAQPVTMPLVEDFEGEAQCPTDCDPVCDLLGWFANGDAHDLDWSSDSGGTSSTNTGPSVDHTLGDASGMYVYTESSCSGEGYPNKTSHLVSPLIDVSAEGALLSFWYHLQGANQGDLSVDVQEPVTAAADYVDLSSGLLVASAADFSDVEVGGHVEISGSSVGNDGVYTVAAVNSATELVLTEPLAADEVFLTVGYHDAEAAWTEDVWGPTTDNVDAWQESTIVALGGPSADLRFRFRNVTGAGFESDAALDDISVFAAIDHEALVGGVTVNASCADAAAEVTVSVQNLGSSDQVDLQVQYTLNTDPTVVETIALVGSFETIDYTFTQTLDLSAGGAFDLLVEIVPVDDTDTTNNSETVTGDALAMVDASGYFEDFESGDGDWAIDPDQNTNGNWALGTPADSVINSAASGEVAWVTGLNGDYPNNMLSAVVGPCLDFSTLTDPEIQLSVWFESEFSWDGAVLQYTTDGGGSWTDLGASGDEYNWYTDGTINGLPAPQDGWTGRANSNNGSGGWLLTSHEAAALAGLSGVQLRVLFGSDGSVADEGFGFDDVRIVEGAPGVVIWQSNPEQEDELVWPGDLNVLVIGFSAMAMDATQTFWEIYTGGGGTTVDGAELLGTLWEDDGDGVFDPTIDAPLLEDVGADADGSVLFTLAPEIEFDPYDWSTFWVSFDVGAGAVPGQLLTQQLVTGDFAWLPDDLFYVTSPMLGLEYTVFGAVDELPFIDAFDETAFNRLEVAAAGDYPQATGAGGAISLVTTVNDAVVYEATSSDVQDIPSGGYVTVQASSSPDLAAIVFPSGEAAGAIDWLFDFSALDASTDLVRMDFAWNHANEELHNADGVFLSVDGGSTWIAKAFEFTFVAVSPEWSSASVDLSAALLDAGVDFTDAVVVRVQAMGSDAETLDGLLLDDFAFGLYQEAVVTNSDLVVIAQSGTDDLGSLEATLDNSLTWSVENVGDFPLAIDTTSLLPGSTTNVNDLNLTGLDLDTLGPGESQTFGADFQVTAPGAFSFEFGFGTDDPRRSGGVVSFTASGTGYVEPELWVETGFGPTGDGDVLTIAGSTTGVGSTLDVGIGNDGTGELTLGGAAPDYLGFANANNVLTDVLVPPAGVVSIGGVESATLEFVPAADGPWSADVVLLSDDPDYPVFVFTVEGDATVPVIGVDGPAGAIANAGADAAGDARLGVAQSRSFAISNSGSADLVLDGAPVPVALGGMSNVAASVTADPTSPVASLGSTAFDLEYTVPALGAFSFEVTIESNDPDDDPFVFTVEGVGVEPEIEVSVDGNPVATGDVIALGDAPVGVALAALFEVGNVGTAELALDGMPDPVAFSGETNVTPSVATQPATPIGAGLTESFDVGYVITADGAFSFDVSIPSDDADEAPFVMTLEGNGVSADYLLSRDAVAIADGGTDALGDLLLGTSTLTWSIDNAGTGSLALTGDPDAVALANTVNVTAAVTVQPAATVDAASSQTFDVEFTPDALGAFSFDLVLETDSVTAPTYTISVTGTAVEPDLQVSKDVLVLPDLYIDDLGDLRVGEATLLEYGMANPGTAPLTLTGDPDLVAIEGAVNVTAAVTAQPTAAELGVGTADFFSIEVSPDADGAFGFDVVIASDDPDTPVFTFTVVGNGVSPVIEVARDATVIANGGSDDLGGLSEGVDVSFTWTIDNAGTSDLTIDALAVVSEDAVVTTLTPPAEDVLAAGAGTTFDVEVVPVAAVPFEFVVTIENDDEEFTMTVLGMGEPVGDDDDDSATGDDDDAADDDDDDDDSTGGCDCSSSLTGRSGSPLALLGLGVGLLALRRRLRKGQSRA